MEGVTATIHSFSEVSPKTFEVTLRLGDPFVFTPGQSIELCVPDVPSIDSLGNCRNFSIVSSANNTRSLTVVLRDTDSCYERTLLNLTIGSKVIVKGPFGNFTLPKENTQDIVFLASGVGIAPCMSLVRALGETKAQTPTTFLYANSTSKHVLYIKELEEIAHKSPFFKLNLQPGDLDISAICGVVEEPRDKKWYVAGSPSFVLSALYHLREVGVSDSDVTFEEMSGYGSKMNLVNKRMVISKEVQEHKEAISQSKLEEGLHSFTSPLLRVLSELALVVVTDSAGDIIHVNDYFKRVSQYTEEEILGKNYNIFNSGKYSQSYYDLLAENVIKKGQILHEEMSNKAKDGSVYWVDSSIVPHFDSNGKVTNYVGVGFLITDKIKAKEDLDKNTTNLEHIIDQMKVKETELENTKKAILNILEDLDEEKKAVERRVEERTVEIIREKEKLQQVTKNIKDGVLLLDSNGLVIFANEGLYQLFGVSLDVPMLAVLEAVYTYVGTDELRGLFDRCLRGEVFTIPEFESQGKIFEIYFNNLIVKEDGKDSTNYFILISEVTDAKLLERSKSELVAVASHQLRTPLTAMRGNIEMLIDESYGQLNPQQHELLADVDVSTNRLIGMVNDMLDITKIEKGNLDMVLEPVNLKEIMDSICTDFHDYAKRRAVSCDIDIQEDTYVYGDKSRVRQVLQNLIDNSIKYSRSPGILHVSSSVEGDSVKIILKDNGLGIPKIEQSKIFNRFYRASNVNKSSSSGSGLGLYIVKSIIEQMHGDISFESEENIGTTFCILLPMSKS